MRKIAALLTAFLLSLSVAWGQARVISGTVTDDKGDVFPGASIQVKGSKNFIAADNNGQFRLLVNTGDVLVITGTGIDPTEITVGSNNTLSITVKRNMKIGTEVVITSLGQFHCRD